MHDVELRRQARAIAENGRALAFAVGRGSVDQQVATEDLEASAQEWVARSSPLPGFDGGAESAGDPQSREELLDAIETDMNVAGVLLAAGVRAEEVDTDEDADLLLTSSVERLERHLARSDRTGGLTAGFDDLAAPAEAEHPSLAAAAEATINCVVGETLTVLDDARTRLTALLPDAVAKAGEVFDSILDAAPQVGRFVRLGLQALKRALLALQQLLPEELRAKIKTYAEDWWKRNGDDVERTVVARLVGEPDARRALGALPAPPQDEDAATRAQSQLEALIDRYTRLAKTYAAVLGALAAAVAVATLIAVFSAAVASWVPLAAAVGYLVVAGSIIVFARDYLDTGGLLSNVDGVQRVVRTVIAQK